MGTDDSNDEDIFQDDDSYSTGKKEGLTYNQIIFEQIKVCCQACSKEQRGGYIEKKIVTNNSIPMEVETYIPDSREIFSNSVRALISLIGREKYDEPMLNFQNEIDERFKDLEKEIIEKQKEKDIKPQDVKEFSANQKFEIYWELLTRLLEFVNRSKILKKKEFEA